LAGYGFGSAPPITSALFTNSFIIATLTTVMGTAYPAYSAMRFSYIEPKGMPAESLFGEVKRAKISEALKDILQYVGSPTAPSNTMNFRVPDSLARNLALTLLGYLPIGSNVIEASTWEAEPNFHRIINCVLILTFDENLPLRHVPKILSDTSDSYRRVVLVPESTFQNLTAESQQLVSWFLEPRVEGRPAPASTLEASDSSRNQTNLQTD